MGALRFSFTVALWGDQHLMLGTADGGITHYDPNGWDHGAGWKGPAADSLPVLLGLIAESSDALESDDDAVRAAAVADLRERMTGLEPYVTTLRSGTRSRRRTSPSTAPGPRRRHRTGGPLALPTRCPARAGPAREADDPAHRHPPGRPPGSPAAAAEVADGPPRHTDRLRHGGDHRRIHTDHICNHPVGSGGHPPPPRRVGRHDTPRHRRPHDTDSAPQDPLKPPRSPQYTPSRPRTRGPTTAHFPHSL